MARRAVEALVEEAEQAGFQPGEALVERLLSAGRELAASRPGVGVAGAVGRVLAAAQRERPARRPAPAARGRGGGVAAGGRRRAGASIAVHLKERLTGAVVLTHSASATVREALAYTPPERVICTVSSPQEEGEFAQELREAGLEVELVPDGEAPGKLEWASLLLVGADTVFHDGTLSNQSGTRGLAEAAATAGVPLIVACEVMKLAPLDAPPRTAST